MHVVSTLLRCSKLCNAAQEIAVEGKTPIGCFGETPASGIGLKRSSHSDRAYDVSVLRFRRCELSAAALCAAAKSRKHTAQKENIA